MKNDVAKKLQSHKNGKRKLQNNKVLIEDIIESFILMSIMISESLTVQ